MKKIWPYITMFFIGLSSGIVVAVKWLNERVVVNVKKQRIRGNENRMNVDVPLNGDIMTGAKKTNKEERKEARIIKRNKKRTDKAAKRLENNS